MNESRKLKFYQFFLFIAHERVNVGFGLRPLAMNKVVISLKALLSFHCILQFELHLGVRGAKLERDLVYQFTSEGIV